MAITQLRGTDGFKIIRARFTGKNKSLGYITNEFYELRLYDNSNLIRIEPTGVGLCSYNSLSSFLDNWDNIQVIQRDGKKVKNK